MIPGLWMRWLPQRYSMSEESRQEFQRNNLGSRYRSFATVALLIRDLGRLLPQCRPGTLGQMRDRTGTLGSHGCFLDIATRGAPLLYRRHALLLLRLLKS
jgi:hypothetical protein